MALPLYPLRSTCELHRRGSVIANAIWKEHLNETELYILDAIKSRVWSGFYDESDIHQLIDDIIEKDADEKMLRESVPIEFGKKLIAEKSWPEQTTCDRLNDAFEAMRSENIAAIQNAGYTMSDGFTEVAEMLHQIGRGGVLGYCFYHGQDLERAVCGEGLMLAFGDLEDTQDGKIETGKIVVNVMQANGFSVEWDQDPEKRISTGPFEWQRKYSG